MSVLESAAHFQARCKLFRIGEPLIRTLTRLGFETLGQLAYCVGQPGQQLADDQWHTWVQTSIPAASAGEAASVRRLVFEAQTLTLADLKDQVTNPSASAARPLAEAERDKRMAALKAKVSGVIIEGDAEPSRALLELACAMSSLDEIRYIAPEKCTSRLSEVALAKPLARVVELEQQRLVLKDQELPCDAQVHNPLLLSAAFRRRGLALAFADVVDFLAHEKYVNELMRHLTNPDALPGGACQLHQVVEADRLVHVWMLEKGIRPRRKSDGSRAMDDALFEALSSYRVSFVLIPRGSTAAGSGGGRGRKRKKTKDDKGKKDDKAEKIPPAPKDPPARPPKGPGKGAANRAAVPKAILDKGGKAQTPDGKAICYGFSLGECRVANCPRAHVCARCFGNHSLMQCQRKE